MPADQASTVACAANIVAPTVPVVKDNCGNILTPSAPVVSTTPTCEGDVTYTYKFTDCEGNTHDWVYTYTIERNDFTMPANQASTVACVANIVAPTVPVVKDNCGNILTPSAPVVSTTPTCEGDVTYTYTFTDCEGNTHDWVYTYTIHDTIAPTGTVPSNLTLQCISDVPVADVNTIIDEADNCSGTVIVSVADTNNGGSGCFGSPYIVTRTYTLRDCAGNSTNLVQKITVQDTKAPTFVEALPVNTTVECNAVPLAPTLTAIDNCGTAVVTYKEVRTDGTCVNNYSLARTWTATDLCGLQTTYTQTVKVQDTKAPTFVETLPVNTSVECNAIPTAPTLTAIDNCGTAVVTYKENISPISAGGTYVITRTWVASDSCGNSKTYIQTINVTIKDYLVQITKQACNRDLSTIDLNALVPPLYQGKGIWVEVNGDGGLKDAIFSPYHLAIGNYVLEYQMNDNDCPRTIEVAVEVVNDCSVLPDFSCAIEVFNAVSPNDDGNNDVFYIRGLECYPDNTVEIYNRWGVLVFERSGYNNTDRAFRGVSEGRVTIKQSDELPVGTYYYIFKYKDSESKGHEKAGFLYLSR
jgi:gliding motility-associated-like protein